MMLKAFILAADSATPEYIIEKSHLFPTLNSLIGRGASASYSAYVQKGYEGSYSSEQNWASVYTGLSPKEHRINTFSVGEERRKPEMRDFDGLEPFWKVLNDNGLSVGLWAAADCPVPKDINGYVVSINYDSIETPAENRTAERRLMLSEKAGHLMEFFNDGPPCRLYPKTLEQQGYTFEQLKNDADIAAEAISKYYFQDALGNFEEELRYFFERIYKVQSKEPVDVLYFFTPTTDLIAHCCMCCDDNSVIIEAYRLLDHYLGKAMEILSPEMTIFVSDHGQQNFKELIKTADHEVQREAFAARDQVLWLKNGYLAFEAHNGALLFTAHALKGTFIAKGKGIRHTSAENARTLDIYPTLLEMLGLKVPEGRQGFIMDIFEKPLINKENMPADRSCISVAFIQTLEADITDIMINEIYIEKRSSLITVVGEQRYREIFLGNPRVSEFVSYEEFDAKDYDEVYIGVYTAHIRKHIQIYRR